MDEYLQCLYQYISDQLLLDACLDLIDYNRWTTRRTLAWNALEKSLTSEQLHLVEDYQSACNGQAFPGG